jgi:hypothetical protein
MCSLPSLVTTLIVVGQFGHLWNHQVICNPQFFTPFMAWKGLFQHLKRMPMDDYLEFKHANEIEIEEC